MSKKVIVLDTETTNSIDDPLCYDIGWAVLDISISIELNLLTNEFDIIVNCEVVKTESFAVAEIFLDKDLMAEAFFADKIPSYWDEIKNGDRKLARLFTIRKALKADCEAYGVKEIYAHNARFDYLSCNLTQRYLTCSKYRYFFPYGTTICDTLKMSRKAFGSDEAYAEFCEVNGYKTANNQNRYTAEILYRFMSGNNDFEEVHKGLDDVLIEKDILLECLKRGVYEGKLWE